MRQNWLRSRIEPRARCDRPLIPPELTNELAAKQSEFRRELATAVDTFKSKLSEGNGSGAIFFADKLYQDYANLFPDTRENIAINSQMRSVFEAFDKILPKNILIEGTRKTLAT